MQVIGLFGFPLTSRIDCGCILSNCEGDRNGHFFSYIPGKFSQSGIRGGSSAALADCGKDSEM